MKLEDHVKAIPCLREDGFLCSEVSHEDLLRWKDEMDDLKALVEKLQSPRVDLEDIAW